MKYRLTVAVLIAVTAVLLCAHRYQPQKVAYTGTLADASTDCDGATDASADLDCLHTDTVTITGWSQIAVAWTYTRETGAAGTAVKIQCDTQDTGDQWYLGFTCGATGTCTPMTWSYATTSSSAGRILFGEVADKLRCRAWVVSGNANDKLRLVIRIASVTGV